MAESSDAPDPRSRPGSGVVIRPALRAGLAFMEAARGEAMGVADLTAWLRVHLADPGYGAMPASVHEPGVGQVSLTAPDGARITAHDQRAARIAVMARVRVAVTLAGLVASPPDDRFLAAGIFAGRVRRANGDRGPAWQPFPGAGDRLSDLVISFFVADVLDHREEYDARLCVCEICNHVGFTFDPALRTRCEQHLH